jgi:flagellar hook-length control protein FliK
MASVSIEAAPEGDAEAIATVKAANALSAASAAKAPKEAAAPVVAEPAAKTEGKPEAELGARAEATPEAKAEAKSEAKPEAKPEAEADVKVEGGTPKAAMSEAKPASDDKPEPASKLSTDDGAPKPDVKDAQHTKHSSEVNREIADGVSTKAADATLAAAKAGIESVQSLNVATAAQPAPPALHLNVTATAAAAGAATANNMASNAVPIDGVAVEIATQSQNGKTSFDIRLDPKELGRIDVRLEVDKDGHVTTKMTVDRVETLDLLKRDASNIERTLQQAGLKTSDNSLEFSLRDQSFSNDNRNDDTRGNANAAQLVIPDDDGASLEAVRSNYGRLLGLGRGLDIRI